MASAASAAAPSSLSRPGSDMSDSIAHPRGDFHRTWGLRPGEPGARLYIVLFDERRRRRGRGDAGLAGDGDGDGGRRAAMAGAPPVPDGEGHDHRAGGEGDG